MDIIIIIVHRVEFIQIEKHTTHSGIRVCRIFDHANKIGISSPSSQISLSNLLIIIIVLRDLSKYMNPYPRPSSSASVARFLYRINRLANINMI